jgi:hypothetical protein
MEGGTLCAANRDDVSSLVADDSAQFSSDAKLARSTFWQAPMGYNRTGMPGDVGEESTPLGATRACLCSKAIEALSARIR